MGFEMHWCYGKDDDVKNELYTEYGINNKWLSPHTLHNKNLDTLNGEFILFTSDHAMAYVDGQIMDYTKTMRRKITSINVISPAR